MPSRSILALALAASLGSVVAERATAGSFVVTNCSDSDPGSLRAGVTAANTSKFYDTIDMSALTCPGGVILLNSTISITTNSLTVLGPGADALAVSGGGLDRVFYHSGAQTLTIQNLTVEYGAASSTSAGGANGGCIKSNGYVSLDHVRVLNCKAIGTIGDFGASAFGGGIWTTAGINLQYSTLSGNAAYATGEGVAVGGGARTSGPFSAAYSTISGNSAQGQSSSAGGGGVSVGGGVSTTITSSTISGNTSNWRGGGLAVNASNFVTIVNSTISGNSSGNIVGGAYLSAPTVSVFNSTIAFNSAQYGGGTYQHSPGLETSSSGSSGATLVHLYSNVLAQNTYGASSIENDFATHASGSATITVAGSANLIRAASGAVPINTITGACPLLGPLRDNGGPTRTHALLSHSPAIDHGANPDVRSQDQRGSPAFPSYPRQSGGAVDIGAYEVQQDDIVFNAGFDGCAPL